jgi:hypothetical protein
MSLITAYEVLKYSTAGNDYPTAQFCELIPQIEQEFARDCIGPELYEYFLSKLAPYPVGLTEFVDGEDYDTGEKVIRNGCIFVSIVNNNQSDPLSETGDWEAWERFTEENVQAFWEKYLRRLLALKVYMASLIYTTWRAGAGGVTIAAGDSAGMRAANKAEMSDVKTGLINEIERVTQNMRYWIRDNGTSAGFPSTFVCNSFNGCPTPGRRQRRWAFKV